MQTPDPPAEVEYVASRDFRLVHFAGHSMVVVDGREGLDDLLCARVARERYGARLVLSCASDGGAFTLTGEEVGRGRSLDFGAMVEHLSSKLQWVEALPDEDHVARFRIRDLAAHPDRLDEVIGEIAMGRSILEG